MTNKERKQRLKVLKDQLTLINLYTDEFLERLGRRGLEQYINEILDEMNFHKDQLN